jgi:hypothetical protein
MAIQIGELRCKVRVATSSQGLPTARDPGPERPEMDFAIAPTMDGGGAQPSPGESATQGRPAEQEGEESTPKASPKAADPKVVASRVYDLMLEQIRLNRLRGG